MTGSDLAPLLRLAERAARLGGDVVGAAGQARDATAKGAGDYVTDVDRRSEEAIVRFLASKTPDIPVLGEEEGGRRGERYWLVDPLDGTTNFMHGFPIVAVSVALIDGARPVVGAVHAPFLGETYLAARGHGASVRRRRDGLTLLRVSARTVGEAVVATGFPFRDKSALPRYLKVLERALDRFEDLRRAGAAALDLAWVAAGVFDGFFELGLSPWDVAAGGLLVEEAGGRVSDWGGGPDYLAGNILAGPETVHGALLEIVRGADRPPAGTRCAGSGLGSRIP